MLSSGLLNAFRAGNDEMEHRPPNLRWFHEIHCDAFESYLGSTTRGAGFLDLGLIFTIPRPFFSSVPPYCLPNTPLCCALLGGHGHWMRITGCCAVTVL